MHQAIDDPSLTVALASAQQLLNRQARQVLRGDVNASADVPFVKYHVRLSGGARPSPHQVRVGRFSSTTVITYRIAGEGVDVRRVGQATFRRVNGDWVLVSSRDDRRDLWAHGPVEVETAGRSLVIGSSRYASLLPGFTASVNQARSAVADFWGGRWPGSATVVLPGSERVMNPLVGSPAAVRLPAVTSWLPLAGGGFARTTINPKVYFTLSTLGRQIVLRHEITHLAEDSLDADSAPLWLSEGLAEYVGYRDSGVPASLVAGDALTLASKGELPGGFPNDDLFNFANSNGERSLGYEYGWSLCRTIAENYGESRLVPFFRAVVDADGPTNWQVDHAARQVLGISRATLLEQWRTWLAEKV